MLKTIIKLTLIITIFSFTAYADGDMNEGQRGDMGSGNLVCAECDVVQNSTKEGYDESFIKFIQRFFGEIIN